MEKNSPNSSQHSAINHNTINIEVAYAGDSSQAVIPLAIEAGSRLREAIFHSGIMHQFPELGSDPHALNNRVGIFGEIKALDTVLNEGDRVEIYRALKIDPKEARKERAMKEREIQKKLMIKKKNIKKEKIKKLRTDPDAL
jgi:putative ubiquitin-RnfH superfamily antitoxin RatB of RatAB toxin-antitoxin module